MKKSFISSEFRYAKSIPNNWSKVLSEFIPQAAVTVYSNESLSEDYIGTVTLTAFVVLSDLSDCDSATDPLLILFERRIRKTQNGQSGNQGRSAFLDYLVAYPTFKRLKGYAHKKTFRKVFAYWLSRKSTISYVITI